MCRNRRRNREEQGERRGTGERNWTNSSRGRKSKKEIGGGRESLGESFVLGPQSTEGGTGSGQPEEGGDCGTEDRAAPEAVFREITSCSRGRQR